MSPSGMLLPTHCMQSSLSPHPLTPSLSHYVSICPSPSLCVNGVQILENFVAQDKSRGAASHGIRHPPYHPDDPECQLPSLALQGVACHSGCGSCVSGIEEALTVCHWRSEKLQYSTARCWTAVGQPITHTSMLKGMHKHLLTYTA